MSDRPAPPEPDAAKDEEDSFARTLLGAQPSQPAPSALPPSPSMLPPSPSVPSMRPAVPRASVRPPPVPPKPPAKG
jgi:hypothetical protein